MTAFEMVSLPARPGPRFDAGDGRSVMVNTPDKATLMAGIERRLTTGQGFTVATLNLDHLVKLQGDPAFREAYLATSHVVADGWPVVWLARLQGRPVSLAPGSELVEPVCALAARLGMPVALFGATEAALCGAARRLEAAHPGLRIVMRLAPPFGFDPDGPAAAEAVGRLRDSGARLCLIALGAPKQERFAVRAAAALPSVGFLSVGAGLDFIAGTQIRAPHWVRRIAMEWLWRMLGDPRRLASRYGRCFAALPRLAMESLRRSDAGTRYP
jgi:exopolysaccharide biosynthesis WecB/TagA/CpsF family protein